MAIVINGSGTITGVSAGGLPDGSVTADDLATSLDLTGKTVTLPSGTGGKVLQVVNASYSSELTTNSTTYVDTGLSATITPSSTSSKILVIVNQQSIRASVDTVKLRFKLVRGSTDIFIFDPAMGLKTVGNIQHTGTCYLDSPATTSSTTYKTQTQKYGDNGNIVIQSSGGQSTMTLMEIAG